MYRINFFDTSPYYGRLKSETRLGRALEVSLKETGISREDIFLSTKVGRYDVTSFDFSADKVRQSVLDSMDRLKTDYLDLCICHDVEFVEMSEILENTLPVLIEYKKQGIIRNIGISGLYLPVLLKIAENANHPSHTIDYVLTYCHNTLQNNMLCQYHDKFKDLGIKIINASPLSMGLLTRSGPPSWHPASQEILQLVRKSSDYCDSIGSDISKIALQYSVQNSKFATTTLVGMRSVIQVEQSVEWINQDMDSDTLLLIQTILDPIHNQIW
jgi:L-galactose dehydrogenase